MNLFTLFVLSILYAINNAGMDYITFALGTADAFHLLKYFDRLFLILIGVNLGTMRDWKYLRWYWWILIGIIFLILIKLAVWDTSYYTLRDFWTWVHNSCHITTGIYFLDKFLGFQMP